MQNDVHNFKVNYATIMHEKIFYAKVIQIMQSWQIIPGICFIIYHKEPIQVCFFVPYVTYLCSFFV